MSMAKLVFFSGGTALKAFSQYLARLRFPSAHLVTTFDSGGSSATLRKAFAMPAPGDLRNRLLALADPDKTPPALIALCNTRIPADVGLAEARCLLEKIIGDNPLFAEIPPEEAAFLQRKLQAFLKMAPKTFDARGASIGNLLLTVSYLENGRDLEAAISLFAALFHIQGSIAPIVNSSLQLGAKLKNGQTIVGQHLFAHLPAPVDQLFLTVHESKKGLDPEPGPIFCRPPATSLARSYLEKASLICFPMGSFYSSILANLLPEGVGKSVAASKAIKVFIPNSGSDPEAGTLSLAEQARQILAHLMKDAPEAQVSDLLNYILLDSEHGHYPDSLAASLPLLRDLGIKILDRPLIRGDAPAVHAPEALYAALGKIQPMGE